MSWPDLSKLFSHDEAFGLPKGTVRAVVLVILTTSVCLLSILSKDIPDTLSMAFAASVAYYFAQKHNGQPPNTAGGVA